MVLSCPISGTPIAPQVCEYAAEEYDDMERCA